MNHFRKGSALQSLFSTWSSRNSCVGLLQVLMPCLALVFLQGCATTQKIAGDTFIEEGKGYRFVLPGKGWEIDEDAWTYQRDFGYLLLLSRPGLVSRRTGKEKKQQEEELDIRPLARKFYEKQIFHMDIGFRHTTHGMKLLAATVWEGDLLDLLKERQVKTDSDIGQNLVRAYMERFADFHPPRTFGEPVITESAFAGLGEVSHLQWTGADDFWGLYGIRINREFLFFMFRADKNISATALQEGMQALDRLVETTVVFKNP